MDSGAIPQTQVPHTSKLFRDYLYDFSRVSEFFPFPPFDPESFASSARSLQYPDALRHSVVAVLRECNEVLSPGTATRRNLERLAKPGCYAVVTGQQVGLFSGPVFAIYKALTAIKLARALSDRGLEAVPVFWLATEDHDLAEVNHCFVQDREGAPRRLEYAEAPAVPNTSAGLMPVTEGILPLLETLRELLPDTPAAADLVAAVTECYRPGVSLGAAFGQLMGRLFAEHGVVLVDPLDARLHALSARVFEIAITSAQAILEDLQERNRRLAESGYHAQVHVAESNSVLFLYENGQRAALRLEDGQFVSSLGRSYAPKELLACLQRQPALFSPNVLLRPVMQDALLPTIAYVGGPSEVAYLAQTAPLYERVLGRMPVAYPRANFTVVDPASNRLLGKYGLSLTDVFSGRQALREKMAERFLPEGLMAVFQKAAENLHADLEEIRKRLEKLDPTLVDAAAHSGQKMQYQLTHLEHKAAAAVQHRSDQVEKDATRLENNLFPEKTLQERIYGGISLLARFGMPLLGHLYDAIDLHSGDHQVIIP